jgi:hypothetical protein
MFDSPVVYYIGSALIGLAIFIALYAFIPNKEA